MAFDRHNGCTQNGKLCPAACQALCLRPNKLEAFTECHHAHLMTPSKPLDAPHYVGGPDKRTAVVWLPAPAQRCEGSHLYSKRATSRSVWDGLGTGAKSCRCSFGVDARGEPMVLDSPLVAPKGCYRPRRLEQPLSMSPPSLHRLDNRSASHEAKAI